MASVNPSATPTIVDDDDSASLNEQMERERFPGPEVQEKVRYLVEFEPNDPLNPQACPRIFVSKYYISY